MVLLGGRSRPQSKCGHSRQQGDLPLSLELVQGLFRPPQLLWGLGLSSLSRQSRRRWGEGDWCTTDDLIRRFQHGQPQPARQCLCPLSRSRCARSSPRPSLCWDAEALSDQNGLLALDLPLADNVTTCRLTGLASTQAGELGVATYELLAMKDFFIDLDLPPTIKRGELVTVTVTLHNYLPEDRTIRLEPAPADWYRPGAPAPSAAVPSEGGATAQFSIRASVPVAFHSR